MVPERPHDSLRRLGPRIRALRVAVGVTQEKLAYECGHSKGYLSDVESGKRVPSLEFLADLMERLDQPLCAVLMPVDGEGQAWPAGPKDAEAPPARALAASPSPAPYRSGRGP